MYLRGFVRAAHSPFQYGGERLRTWAGLFLLAYVLAYGMHAEQCAVPASVLAYPPRVCVVETIDCELRLVATLRPAAREPGGPLPPIVVADALLDERREMAELAN